MKLMYALSLQLGAKNLDENAFQQKAGRALNAFFEQVEWLQELWLTLELGDKVRQASKPLKSMKMWWFLRFRVEK